MGKIQDKAKIVETIIKAAAEYKAKMVGRSFLYVFEGRSIEVVYRTKDFMHLTGVQTAAFRGQQGRVSRTVRAILSGQLG